MAKNSGSKPPTPSRIRFVMVEAELGDGDIGQITQAIQNALRSAPTSTFKRLASGSSAINAPVEPEIETEVEDGEEEAIDPRPIATKSRIVRKPAPTPDVVQLDMNSDVSLSSFANGKDTSSQHKKYLISAAWLKEHRSIDSVSAGHIYTCFRSMEWPTNIPDFWQPLRDLKRKKYFSKNDQNEYEINHIGLDYVRKLGGSNGAK